MDNSPKPTRHKIQGGSTGRVYSDPLMQKAYDEGGEHGATISEGRLREARERILSLPEHRISSGNSTWDDCEPIVYLRKRDVLAALEQK